jgi:hypothetical protein
MSDEEYPEEDYEYEYSDDEDSRGDEDVSMEDSTDAAGATTSARRNINPNKKRPFGSMDGKRRIGENPNAPPLNGGEFISKCSEAQNYFGIVIHPYRFDYLRAFLRVAR